jgi:ribose/xylose/arabinose/galactoside ABC-type transport system permease subunit
VPRPRFDRSGAAGGLPASPSWSRLRGARFFLDRHGRHIYAIGGNPHAARVSGINVDRVLVLVYVICGFFAGLGGLQLAGRTYSGFPNAGIGAELDAIAAVIIGGASFFGGRGTVLGVFGGVIVMGLISNGLNLNNVSVFWQQILIGMIIVLAVYMIAAAGCHPQIGLPDRRRRKVSTPAAKLMKWDLFWEDTK